MNLIKSNLIEKNCDGSIHLIYAGGTFGSYGNPLSPLSSDVFLPTLIEQLKKQRYQVGIVDNAVVKDSSCLTPDDFIHFYRLIYQSYQKHQIKQFVLITGTDTLSFLAAFLSFACQHLPICLIVTGSMSPLLQTTTHPYTLNKQSDAWANLKDALHFLDSPQCSNGVFVSFHQKMMHAVSVQKIHSSDNDAFVGTAVNLTCNNNQKSLLAPSFAHHPEKLNLAPTLHTLYCTPNTADDFADMLIPLYHATPSAIILIGYGAGNLPSSDKLINTINTLINKGFLIIMASSCIFGARSTTYEAGAWQYQIGVLPSDDLPMPTIYAQALWLCLSLPVKKRALAWKSSLAQLGVI